MDHVRGTNQMKKALVIAVLAVIGALLPASGGARTAATNCTGLVTGGTFADVVVPAGQSCQLDGVRVTGSVTVQTGASLEITNLSADSTVRKDVKGNGCDFIELEATSLSNRIAVGGNLVITNCTGTVFNGGQASSFNQPPPSILIGKNVTCSANAQNCVFDYFVVGGSVTCSGNAEECTVNSNGIGGSATLNNNQGGITVDHSVIGGNLACSGNTSTNGATNTVAGTKSGQCSSL
jgi:hypothetical protein